MDFKSDEKDMIGDRESNQEATLPGAGDSGAGDPGPAAHVLNITLSRI